MAGAARAGRYLRALRAFSFPLSGVPVWIGAAAALPVSQWRWDVLVAATLAVLALHSAGNLLNDYFDFTSGADSIDEDDEGRPGRLLVRGEMSPRQVAGEAAVCLAVAAALVGYVAWRCDGGVLWFFGAALLALYAYTGPPFRLKGRALGEPLILAVFGPLIVGGAAYAQAGRVGAEAWLLSVPIGMATASVLAGNNLRDYAEDRAGGLTTLAQLIGPQGQIGVYVALLLGQTFVLAAFGALTGRPALAAAPLSLLLLVGVLRRALRGERIPDIDARTARYAAALMGFTLIVLVLS